MRDFTIKQLRERLDDMEKIHDAWPDVEQYLGKFEDQPCVIWYYEWDEEKKCANNVGLGPMNMILNNTHALGVEFDYYPNLFEVEA